MRHDTPSRREVSPARRPQPPPAPEPLPAAAIRVQLALARHHGRIFTFAASVELTAVPASYGTVEDHAAVSPESKPSAKTAADRSTVTTSIDARSLVASYPAASSSLIEWSR